MAASHWASYAISPREGSLICVRLNQMKPKLDQIWWICSFFCPLSNGHYAPLPKVEIELDIEFRKEGPTKMRTLRPVRLYLNLSKC